ncbi:hypothetical protein NDU88_003575, partial [Pleurodeles waltl]
MCDVPDWVGPHNSPTSAGTATEDPEVIRLLANPGAARRSRRESGSLRIPTSGFEKKVANKEEDGVVDEDVNRRTRETQEQSVPIGDEETRETEEPAVPTGDERSGGIRTSFVPIGGQKDQTQGSGMQQPATLLEKLGISRFTQPTNWN